MKALLDLFGFCIVTILMLTTFNVFAQKDENDLFELSLKELINVSVSVSSHREESIVDTPAIVSRYDMRDMAAMGLRSLKDVLSFIPGVLVQEHVFGQPFIAIRGVYEGFNQKVLFLLDDVPYFMPSHSDIPLLGIPIESISHVEIIRGPGAVYYGTNATSGVIKVITKGYHKGEKLTVAVGENNYLNSSFTKSFEQNSHNLSIAAEVQKDSGYLAQYPAFPSKETPQFLPGQINKPEETASVLVKYNYGDFNLSGHSFKTTYTGLAQPSYQINNVNHLTYEGYLLAANYHWNFDDISIKLFADYNRFYPDFEIEDFIGPDSLGGFAMGNNGQDNYRLRFAGNLTYTLSANLELFAGAETEERSTEDYQIVDHDENRVLGTIMPSFQVRENSLLAQLNYKTDGNIRFVFGGRYTDNEIIGSYFVPRGSVVYQLDELS